ncbi:MAG: LysM domain protein [Chloroflexi bacterium]|nr:LysM domain protein [Chloroflexota bacterium]
MHVLRTWKQNDKVDITMTRRDSSTVQSATPARPAEESLNWGSALLKDHRPVSRRDLLGAGLAGLFIAMTPTGLLPTSALAATNHRTRVARLPARALLAGYPQLYQQHTLSCEAAVASMATGGRLSEQRILDQMPRDPNPWLGFRGSVDGGQSLADGLANYGIYAPPLAGELQRFGYQTQVIEGATAPDMLRRSIAELHRPVEVWVTHYLGNWSAITGYAGGRSFTLVNGEHARLAIGYDTYGIHSLDPLEGHQYDPWASFLGSWARFNYMGIVVGTA